MSVYGGIEAVGLFDMAQRFILQARQLVNGPMQVLVPAFAGVSERSSEELRELFVRSYCLSVLIGVPIMMLAVLGSPIVAHFWLGTVSILFCIFVAVLAVAWTVSLISAPGYLLATGVGRLRWNILGNLTVTTLALALASVLGAIWGSVGVAVGSALALISGNLIMIAGNARSVSVPVIPGRMDFRVAIREALP
jgi:O-antigen/teichoic acid export membrane protein